MTTDPSLTIPQDRGHAPVHHHDAIWLASHGGQVTAVDASTFGLARGRQRTVLHSRGGRGCPGRVSLRRHGSELLALLAVGVHCHERPAGDGNSLVADAAAWASTPRTSGGGR